MCSCSICKLEKSPDPPEDLDLSFFYCTRCNRIFCPKCVINSHLKESPEHLNQIYHLCDDCESIEAPLFCKSCGQNLCSECDGRIHNKGKRAQHNRETRELPLRKLYERTEIDAKELINKGNKAIILCSQNFFKDFEKNIRILIESKGVKSLVLLILEVMKDEKTGNFEKVYEKILNKLRETLPIDVLIYSFEKHAKNKLKSFIKTNTLLIQSRSLIELALFITTGIKYLDLQILEEIFSEKNQLFSNKTQLFFLESLNFSKEHIELLELNTSDQMKNLEIRTFEEISKTVQPLKEEEFLAQFSKSQASIKNPNASFHLHMNTSASSFESSALFLPNMSQNPLNHSFGAGNLNISSNDMLHSALNNSFDPGVLNKSESLLHRSNPYMPYYQKMREIELRGLVKLGLDLQRELNKLANEGELLIQKPRFLDILAKLMKNSTFSECEAAMREAEQLNIIHVTIRKFEGYPERQEFISLNLEYLSLESMTWVLKSIRKDAMTPTEKIILSRIKECFRLKITPKQWEKVLISIKFQKFSQETDPYSTLNKPSLPIIVLSKIKDPLIGNETNVLKFKGQEWNVEDQGKVEDDKDPLWKTFITFLNNYFKSQSQKSKLEEIPEKVEKTSESEINFNDNSLNDYELKARHISTSEVKFSEETKAIPGGRYGCAQFIKTCAPDDLRKCSLGKLNLYVQEAINKGFIKYHRTLLVKDYSRDEENSFLEGSANISGDNVSILQREAKIKALQKTTLEILKENPNGVSLAQIPQFLKMKALFPFNLQELGFPKLKNFLASMPERIKIEMAGTNNSYAYLAESHEETVNIQKTQILHPKMLAFTGGPPLMGNPTAFNQKNTLDKKGLKKKFNTLKYPIAEKVESFKPQNRKKVSSLEEYLNKVVNMIYSILIEHNYGLRSDKLYSELCKKLSVDFNYRLFNCPDFYTFLVNYLENMIDVECKNFAFYIYPKDFRFGPIMSRKKEQHPPEEQINVNNNNNNNNNNNINNISNNNINSNPMISSINSYNKPQNPIENPNNANSMKPKPNFNLNLNSTPFNYNEQFHKNGIFSNSNPQIFQSNYGKFNTINNMIGFSGNIASEEDFYSMHKKSLSIANYGPSLYKHGNLMQHAMFNLSPNGNATTNGGSNQGNSVLSPHIRSPSHNRNISYWNINGPAFDPTSFINNGSISIHSRNDSKNTITRKNNEESNIELNENLKFIEELLQEKDDQDILTNYEKNNETSLFKSISFSVANVPNTYNFNMISAIKPSPFDMSHNNMNEKMHSKALSDDFNDFHKKKLEEKANIIKQHGRVQSNLEKNKPKDDEDEESDEY